MAFGKKKIEREKVDYKKALVLLMIQINKKMLDLRGWNVPQMKMAERGINSFEDMLAPYWHDEKDTDKGSYAENKKHIDDELQKITIQDMPTFDKYLNLLRKKYAALYVLADDNNLLLTESEESEA
jgi:hypothetical protein